jgi:hypothetical protein
LGERNDQLVGVHQTLIIGASLSSQRVVYTALHRLVNHGHPVVAIGKKSGTVSGVIIHNDLTHFKDIHTVTLYLNKSNQIDYYDYILSLNPKRVLFNPGTENTDLASLLTKAGIEWEHACTLVLLSTNQY